MTFLTVFPILPVSIKLSADDLKLYFCIVNCRDGGPLQEASDCIHVWCDIWGINFLFHKCGVLHTGPNNHPTRYFINGSPFFPPITLEIWVFILTIISYSISTFLSFLRRLIAEPATCFTLCQALLVYVIEVWSPRAKKDILRVERVQNFFTRVIFKHRLLFGKIRHLNLDSLEILHIFFNFCSTYKIANGLTAIMAIFYPLFSPIKPFHLSKRRFRAPNQLHLSLYY